MRPRGPAPSRPEPLGFVTKKFVIAPAALRFFSGTRRMLALVVVFFVPWLAAAAARLRLPALYFEFGAARRLFARAWAARLAGARPAGDFLDHLLELKEGPQNPLYGTRPAPSRLPPDRIAGVPVGRETSPGGPAARVRRAPGSPGRSIRRFPGTSLGARLPFEDAAIPDRSYHFC